MCSMYYASSHAKANYKFFRSAVTPERVVSAKRFMAKLEKIHKVWKPPN